MLVKIEQGKREKEGGGKRWVDGWTCKQIELRGDKNDRNRCDVRMGRGEERWRYEGTHGTFET